MSLDEGMGGARTRGRKAKLFGFGAIGVALAGSVASAAMLAQEKAHPGTVPMAAWMAANAVALVAVLAALACIAVWAKSVADARNEPALPDAREANAA